MLITSTFTGFSTHLMGGEIVVLNDSQNSYYVLLTLYRDTLGIPISNTQDFTVTDDQGNTVSTLTSTLDLTANHPVFGTSQGQLMTMFPYGVEIYFYAVSLSLPNPGEYTVSWENCCRNGAIGNLTNPSSETMNPRPLRSAPKCFRDLRALLLHVRELRAVLRVLHALLGDLEVVLLHLHLGKYGERVSDQNNLHVE